MKVEIETNIKIVGTTMQEIYNGLIDVAGSAVISRVEPKMTTVPDLMKFKPGDILTKKTEAQNG